MRLRRLDLPGTAVVLAVIGALLALVICGPPEHRTVALTALVGLAGTVSAALRGRLVKRDPSRFAPPASNDSPS
jgi:hypothetical protein